MSKPDRRVGLLTGTFDPVHLGHLALARVAQAACELDEVWFLVNPQPGHKQGVSGLSDRLAMMQLALAGDPTFCVGEPGGEQAIPHTMRDFLGLMDRYPDDEFVFIVGADVLGTIDTWNEPEVARRVMYAAAQRPALDVLVPKDLKVTWFELDEHVAASSGSVRIMLSRGLVPDELDPRVYDYIRAQALYR